MHDRVEQIANFLQRHGVPIFLTHTSDYAKDEDDQIYVKFGHPQVIVTISNTSDDLHVALVEKDGTKKSWPVRQTVDIILKDVRECLAEARPAGGA